MKLRNKILTSLMALGISLVGALAPTGNSYAEEEAQETPAYWIQISPTTVKATLMGGQTLEGEDYEVEVKNIGAKAFRYKVYASPYAVSGEDYSLDFSEEGSTSFTQISRWISFKDDKGNYTKEVTYSLEPGESKKIPYRIVVPEDVAGGAQYAAIWAQTIADGKSDGVQAVSRAGMVIYGRSIGDTFQTAEISDYDFTKFTFGGNMTANATIKNTGNTDFNIMYNYTARTIFGKVLKEFKGTIATFPGDTEYHAKVNWENTPFIGIFTVNWDVTAADITKSETRVVMIMPVFMIVLFILLLTVIIIWIIIIIRKRKERKSRVLV